MSSGTCARLDLSLTISVLHPEARSCLLLICSLQAQTRWNRNRARCARHAAHKSANTIPTRYKQSLPHECAKYVHLIHFQSLFAHTNKCVGLRCLQELSADALSSSGFYALTAAVGTHDSHTHAPMQKCTHIQKETQRSTEIIRTPAQIQRTPTRTQLRISRRSITSAKLSVLGSLIGALCGSCLRTSTVQTHPLQRKYRYRPCHSQRMSFFL